jgi:hypothetical protein
MLKQLFCRAGLVKPGFRNPVRRITLLQDSLLYADRSGRHKLPEIEQICLDHPGNSLYNFDAVHEAGGKPIISG